MISIIPTSLHHINIRKCIHKLSRSIVLTVRYNIKMWYYEIAKTAVVSNSKFIHEALELNYRYKLTTTATFFQNLCPVPWTKRQPIYGRKAKGLWYLVLGPPFSLSDDCYQIIQPVGHSFLRYSSSHSSSKETI